LRGNIVLQIKKMVLQKMIDGHRLEDTLKSLISENINFTLDIQQQKSVSMPSLIKPAKIKFIAKSVADETTLSRTLENVLPNLLGKGTFSVADYCGMDKYEAIYQLLGEVKPEMTREYRK